MPTTPYLQEHDTGTLVRVYIQPRASKTEIVDVRQGRLKIRVTSPPVEGKANAELCSFLSKSLGIAKSRVIVVRGQKTRQKDILLQGVKMPGVIAKLSPLVP